MQPQGRELATQKGQWMSPACGHSSRSQETSLPAYSDTARSPAGPVPVSQTAQPTSATPTCPVLSLRQLAKLSHHLSKMGPAHGQTRGWHLAAL